MNLPVIQLFMKLDSNARHKAYFLRNYYRDAFFLREEKLISSRKIKSRGSCLKPGTH